MKLNSNYSIKSSSANVYSDNFNEIVDLLVEAKENGKITEEEMNLLLRIALKKETKREIKDFFDLFFNNSERQEKNTLFVHLKNSTHYAT